MLAFLTLPNSLFWAQENLLVEFLLGEPLLNPPNFPLDFTHANKAEIHLQNVRARKVCLNPTSEKQQSLCKQLEITLISNLLHTFRTYTINTA